jgi:hypothetical protein
MLRLIAALAVLVSLSAAAQPPLTGERRRQIPEGADWKALFTGRMHYYQFGTIDRPLERRAARVFRTDGTYRVESIDGSGQFTEGKWYFSGAGVCQQARDQPFCYDFRRQADGWEQRSNDGANFRVFIPDVLPPEVTLPPVR